MELVWSVSFSLELRLETVSSSRMEWCNASTVAFRSEMGWREAGETGMEYPLLLLLWLAVGSIDRMLELN